MSTRRIHVAADAPIRSRLESLCPPLGSSEQHDSLFARVVWSRLAEPADAAAGALIAALGPSTALDLLVSRASTRELLDAALDASGAEIDARRLAAGIKRWLPRLDRDASLADLDAAVAHSMQLLTPGCDGAGWPAALDDLGEHAPLLLWVHGSTEVLSARALAVVGARACTGYGAHVTAEFTDTACTTGAVIVSGAAYGIDAVAHRTALAAGTPTVAVVAGGVDRHYPAAHQQLFERIAESGAVCSEMVPGAAPTRWRFLMRNRVIAALASATLVTEAGARSGSLNTAGNAAELGRPLGAVPGPVTSAASTGCHRLISEYAAALIASPDDVRQLLGVEVPPELPAEARASVQHTRVVDALPLRGARTLAETAKRAGLSITETREALAELEVVGTVARRETPGGGKASWALLRRE